MFLVALTRPVSSSFGDCELTHLDREPIDLELARKEHSAYEAALEGLGCRVERLPEADDLPDSVFVEDAAVVVDELAVITRPGAASRRGETAAVEASIAPYRPIARIEAPGTLDGGDVLRVGRDVFVGRSSRTNEAGVAQLRGLLGAHGYAVTSVDARGCLHLKTAVTRIGEELLLVQPAWVDTGPFGSYDLLAVDPAEPFAANALWIGGDDVIFPDAFPATAERLLERGLAVRSVDVSELAKAEGGVTCCSVILSTRTRKDER